MGSLLHSFAEAATAFPLPDAIEPPCGDHDGRQHGEGQGENFHPCLPP
jgi:hypothetical protein